VLPSDSVSEELAAFVLVWVLAGVLGLLAPELLPLPPQPAATSATAAAATINATVRFIGAPFSRIGLSTTDTAGEPRRFNG
jgi:hypothetical protein